MAASSRILSLVPSATDWVTALGHAGSIVGMTHECTLPDGLRAPVVVTPAVAHDPSDPAGVDDAVTRAALAKQPLYAVDQDLVRDLAPTVIVTQELCEVCAVSASTVARLSSTLPGVSVVNMTGVTLEGVLEDGLKLGAALGADSEARRLVGGLRARLESVAGAVRGGSVPAVAFLEWPDPPWAGGHWVPDQIKVAGGTPTLGQAGEPSRRAAYADFVGVDVLVCGPCGYDLDEAMASARTLAKRLTAAGAVWAVDASRCFSRPAPGLVDGVEALAAMLHPELGPPDPSIARRVALTTTGSGP